MTRLGAPERVIDASRIRNRVKHTTASTHPGPRSAAASALGHARFEGPGTGLLAAALDGGHVRPAAIGDAAGVVGIRVSLGIDRR